MATKKEKTEKKSTKQVKKDVKATMPMQNNSQRKADEKSLLDNQEKERKNTKVPSGILTTDGKVIRHATVKHLGAKGGVALAVVCDAVYGKLVEGKTGKEAEVNLKKIPNRALTPEQQLQYQRLNAKDPKAALEYAVTAAYPMHVDDKKFYHAEGEVNGKPVNYIIVRKLTEDDVKNQAGVVEESKRGLIGRWRLSAGIAKGESLKPVILTKEELASYRHRAEVELNSKGEVVKVGKPITLLELADTAVKRSVAAHEAREAALKEVHSIDWNQYHAPLGAKLSHLYTKDSNEEDRQWINGKVNGVEIKGALLTSVETLALKEGVATREQVFMHNAFTRSQAFDINKANYNDLKAHAQEYAVNAIIARAQDPSAGASFTREQVDIINLAIGNTEDRDGAVNVLIEKAEVHLKESQSFEMEWLDSVKDEMKDIAENKWEMKTEQAAMSR